MEPKGPQALTVRVDATALPATIIDELKHVFGNHAGECEVVLAIETSAGPRTRRPPQSASPAKSGASAEARR